MKKSIKALLTVCTMALCLAFLITGCELFVKDCEHTYDNACDVTCNNCGEERAVEDHIPAEDDGEDVRGVLKRRVETRQHTEEAVRQQEVEQLDFRDLLGKKVSTKTLSEEDLKEIPAEQMDFRANLQRQVKPKTLSEEERKVHGPQQVDFRSVLAKKGTPKTPVPEKVPPPKPATPDFRSVLGSKKKLPAENGSNNTEALNAKAAEGPKPVGNAQPSGFLKPVGNAKLAEALKLMEA